MSGDGRVVSLSIEETNKLRESLGLKPLKLEPQQPPQYTQQQNLESEHSQTQKKAVEDSEKQEELIERIQKSRGKRQTIDAIRAQKTIAEEAEEEGDVFSWIQRQRETDAQKEDEEDEEDRKQQQKPQQDEEAKQVDQGQQLKGVKVKHGIKDMMREGESVILTMADQSILDEKGNWREEEDIVLEEVLTREQRDREFARKAAQKQEHGAYDEYGNRRDILDKYDDEPTNDEELLGEASNIPGNKSDALEMKQKLTQGLSAIQQQSEKLPGSSDYMTQDEFNNTLGKKERKKKKLRKKAVIQEEEEGPLDYDALEADAIAKADASADLGSRSIRGQKAQEQKQTVQEKVQLGAERYAEALQKSNLESASLKQIKNKKKNVVPIGEEYDNEFFVLNEPINNKEQTVQRDKSLSTEQRLEQFYRRALNVKKENDNVQQQQQQQLEYGDSAGDDKVLVFQEIGEFARGFDFLMEPIKEEKQEVEEEKEKEGVKSSEGAKQEADVMDQEGASNVVVDVKMEDVEAEDEDMYDAPPEEQQERVVEGGWIKEPISSRKDRKYRKKQQDTDEKRKTGSVRESEVEGITREGGVGLGLASVLEMMKQRGALNEVVEFAGRTNDKKKSKLVGLDEVYQGGMGKDELERSIEVALAKKDQYGRILTPKEAFRELSYRFHGMEPSRNKIERKIKKDREELAIKKATTSDDPAAKIERLQNIHQTIGSAYIPLSGSQTPAPGMLAAAAVVAAPILGAKSALDDRRRDQRNKRKNQQNKNQQNQKKQKKQKGQQQQQQSQQLQNGGNK